jgi:serine phosphatase RsbU (regulator of sigma subunit)
VFPVVLQAAVSIFVGILHGFELLGVKSVDPIVAQFNVLSGWPVPFSAQFVCNLLVQLSLMGILILRFARTRRDEQRFATELEAARIVQQVLIPEEIPAIAGLRIECVYRPAGQVGGDFFQVIPTGEGGALIVIGDVSGKGMPAAMTVSLLVGTVRTLGHYTRSPGEILAAMNHRMIGRTKDGFTTCLVVRIDSDGTMIAANAGHISPYLHGRELQVENGLPLGLVAEASYNESTFHMGQNEQITMVTDGVVEARNKSGDLFGFERTAALSTEHAEKIAQAARAFGQDDDITVLTLTRVGVEEQSIAQKSTPAVSPASA